MTSADKTRVAHSDGLVWLDQRQTSLLYAVDGTVRAAATEIGAIEWIAPPMLPVDVLSRFDCYENFPHLAFVATTLDTDSQQSLDGIRQQAALGEVNNGLFLPGTLGLPTAACWGVYAGLTDTDVHENSYYTLVSRCFRAEEHYEGLRRALGFHMREIVAVGDEEFCLTHTRQFTDWITQLCAVLDLDLEVAPGLDPFFDKETPRAAFARISPVKYEFIVDGISIASVNNHRTFFGDNSSISVAGHTAHTSCVAFGLERWISVLLARGLEATDVTSRTSPLTTRSHIKAHKEHP